MLGVALALALAGTALLAWEHWLARRHRPGFAPRLRAAALATLGVLGLASYTGFGRMHDGGFVHVWDVYHYYIGAKYYPELGYERLYECTAVADAESGHRHDVATRGMTDLRTNQQITSFDILAHPETCLRHFSAERWLAFRDDVAWFHDRADRKTWRRIQRDHGYNATPVWNLIGHGLTNLAPASELHVGLLVLIDPVLLAAMFGLLAWGFGWRVSAIAAIMLGTFYPSRFYWTGGAFLRDDWLWCIVAGLCALRRDRPLLGGAALAGAALLRLFPAALFVGPVIAAIAHRWQTRSWHPVHLRMFAGAALAIGIALPPALALSGDWGRGFVENTRKHADTPLTNHMGLPTVVAYRPDATVRALRPQGSVELWPRFQQVRRDAVRAGRPILALCALGALALLVAVRRRPLWQVAALSLLLVPVTLQLTCYYYVLFIAWATLAERRPGVGAALLALCAGSTAIALAVVPHVGMDEEFVALSVELVIGLAGVIAAVLQRDAVDDAHPWRALG